MSFELCIDIELSNECFDQSEGEAEERVWVRESTNVNKNRGIDIKNDFKLYCNVL